MKVPSIIILVGAMLALAAPTAANARIAPEAAPAAKLVSYYPSGVGLTKKVKKSGNLSHKSGKGTKGTTKVKRTLPLLIWVQGGHGAPQVTSGNDDCLTSMVNCTAQQECETWGYNCFLVEQPTPPAAPASESSSTSGEEIGSSGNLASSEIASAESSAGDAATTIGQVANVIEENWDC
jgi:hypothetical protein